MEQSAWSSSYTVPAVIWKHWGKSGSQLPRLTFETKISRIQTLTIVTLQPTRCQVLFWLQASAAAYLGLRFWGMFRSVCWYLSTFRNNLSVLFSRVQQSVTWTATLILRLLLQVNPSGCSWVHYVFPIRCALTAFLSLNLATFLLFLFSYSVNAPFWKVSVYVCLSFSFPFCAIRSK